VYASYIVKFVCYFLRIIVNEERIKAQLCSNTNSNSNSNNVFTISSIDSSRSNKARSNADSKSPCCRKKEINLIKNTQELFC
jgi:hypothetical protein